MLELQLEFNCIINEAYNGEEAFNKINEMIE
jgi:hypothetical protein